MKIIADALARYGPSAALVARKIRFPQSLVVEYITSDPLCATVYAEMSRRIADEVQAAEGNLTAVAREVGLPRSALETIALDNDIVAEAIAEQTLGLTDEAEAGLRTAIRNGKQWAIELELLKTKRGGARGYGLQDAAFIAELEPERIAKIKGELTRMILAGGQGILGNENSDIVVDDYPTGQLGGDSPISHTINDEQEIENITLG